MKRTTLLVFIILSVSLSALAQAKTEEYKTSIYQSRLVQFAQKPLYKGQIVFLGNSITQAGKWDEYFPNQKPANRGILGDNTQGMLARISEIAEAKPKKLFIMAGINDISQNEAPKHILANLKKMIKQVRQISPNTQIYIQSILPINNDFGQYSRLAHKEIEVAKLNKDLKKLSKVCKLIFVDLYPLFATANGKLKPELTSDGLHINDAGYTIWVNEIRELIEKN